MHKHALAHQHVDGNRQNFMKLGWGPIEVKGLDGRNHLNRYKQFGVDAGLHLGWNIPFWESPQSDYALPLLANVVPVCSICSVWQSKVCQIFSGT